MRSAPAFKRKCMQTDWPIVSKPLKSGLATEQAMVQLMSDRKYPILREQPIWTNSETVELVRLVHKHLESHWTKKAQSLACA